MTKPAEVQFIVRVESHDEVTDVFAVRIEPTWGGAGGGVEEMHAIPGAMLPALIKEYGEPAELVGRYWEIRF